MKLLDKVVGIASRGMFVRYFVSKLNRKRRDFLFLVVLALIVLYWVLRIFDSIIRSRNHPLWFFFYDIYYSFVAFLTFSFLFICVWKRVSQEWEEEDSQKRKG